MTYARPMKHYRVAQKEQEEAADRGTYLSSDQKWGIGAVGIFLMLFVLIESAIVVLMLRNNED